MFFLILKESYTKSFYESRIFATTGVRFDTADLHKLNEGAHYFGQTMIGWSKFPNYKKDMIIFASLPDDSDINMHMQERQNVILTITTDEPISIENLRKAKDFHQLKIDEYNSLNNTGFNLSNVDYDITEVRRDYLSGAFVTLLLTIVLGAGLLSILSPPNKPRLL